MASARLVQPEPSTPPPKRVVLELSEEEAEYLGHLLGSRNDPTPGDKARLNDTIWWALRGVGHGGSR